MTLLINVLVSVYLLFIAPKLFFDRFLKKKRHPNFLQRLGFKIPKTNRPVIWIHAVSVGEIKAAQSLFRALKEREKGAFFFITTTSATGQAEAKRSLSEADAFAYLPLDFSWVVNRFVKQLNPHRFILIESDFWFNLLTALKKNGTQVSLVSGKLSEKSARRFRFFFSFAQKLFAQFDHLCVQNEIHFARIAPFVSRPLHITGNLKLDLKPQIIQGSLDLPQPVITISCTHPLEEELLIDALKNSGFFLIIAPRHPERFEEVAKLLMKKKLPFTRWTQQKNAKEILLLDTMGQLPICYAQSRLAILGGSYIKHIGGHNVLEPCLYGTPVFFGPYMHGQIEFAKRALDSGAGLQVPLAQLRQAVLHFFTHPELENAMRKAAIKFTQTAQESTEKTMSILLDEKKRF